MDYQTNIDKIIGQLRNAFVIIVRLHCEANTQLGPTETLNGGHIAHFLK